MEREIISTGQEIRKCKVLEDLNNYFKAVPENPTLITFLKNPQIPKQNKQTITSMFSGIPDVKSSFILSKKKTKKKQNKKISAYVI